MRLLGKILLICLIIAGFSSCGDAPTAPITSGTIKSETKWLIDPSSSKPDVKVYYKLYDKSGKLVEYTTYDTEIGTKKSESHYTYETSNTSSEITETFDKSGNAVDKSTTVRTYDANKKLRAVIIKNRAGVQTHKEEYSYDNQGNISQKTIFKEGSLVPIEIVYKNVYDGNGFLVERSSTGIEEYVNKEVISYNDGEVKITDLNKEGKVETVTSYIYKYGRVVSEELKDVNNKVLQTYRYDYTYFK